MPGFWYHQTNRQLDYNFKNLNDLVKYLKDFEKIADSFGGTESVLIFNPLPKNKCLKRKWTYKYPLPTFKGSKRDLTNII